MLISLTSSTLRFRFTFCILCFPWKCQVLRTKVNKTIQSWIGTSRLKKDLKSFWWKQRQKHITRIHQTKDSNLKHKVEDGHLLSVWNNWPSDSLELSGSYTSSQHLLWVHPPTWKAGLFEKPHVTCMPNRGHYFTNPCMLRANPTKVLQICTVSFLQ